MIYHSSVLRFQETNYKLISGVTFEISIVYKAIFCLPGELDQINKHLL